MSNLHIIETTDKAVIASKLGILTRGGGSVFANNGTYAFPKDALLPTTLAAFQFIVDRFATSPNDVLLVALNSDASMQVFYDGKGTPAEERENFVTRAAKITGALSSQFAGHRVVIIVYDEETPHELYEHLSNSGLPLDTLYKFGYGTDKKAPPIIGGEFFERVLAFPMPNDEKPFAFDQTEMRGMPFVPEFYNLTKEDGSHGVPYLTPQGKILFPVVPELRKYTASFDAHP